MKPEQLDPSSFPTDHPVSVALRKVSTHWFLAYSKLMSMQWVWSDAVPYGATDGRTLMLNKAGIDKLCRQPDPAGLIAFLLVHEALHGLLGHCWRLASLPDPKTGNRAADYVVNAMIAMRNRELKRVVFPFIEGVLLDEQLSGDKSVEQLYRELSKPQPKQETQQSNEPDTTQDSGAPDGPAESQPDTTEPDTDPDSSADGASDGGDDGDDVAGSNTAEGGTSCASTDNDLSDFVGKGNADCLEPALEEGETYDEVVQKVEEDNERILVSDAIDRKTSSDSGATGQRVAAQRTVSSALDWCALLREWMFKSRRAGWDSPFNPAVHSTTRLACAGRRSRAGGTIVLALDTSGSIGAATYTKFLQQAQSILDELKPEQLVLLSVSHQVCDALMLESGDYVPQSLKGGGGTKFQPAFDWLADNFIEPDVMVYLTDGWSPDLHRLQEQGYPLLWLSTSRNRKDYPIGDVIEITDF
jgi:predicted metal-dependent peptidase